jgi:hypothetical protein
MTIASSVSKTPAYACNGVTTSFPYAFKLLSTADMAVILQNSAGVSSMLVYGTDFTLTGVGNDAGGNIVTTTAYASGNTLTGVRVPSFLQGVDLQNQGAFFAQVIEDALDLAAQRDQYLLERVERSIQLPITAPSTTDTDLPLPEANKLIGWNGAGTGLQNVDGATLATIVAFGTMNADTFLGNGATVAFTLSASPGAQANLDVSIDGFTLVPGVDYIWASGTTITFTTAPSSGAEILARYSRALPQGAADANAVTTDYGITLGRLLELKAGTVAQLLADTTLTYSGVGAGDILEAGGFRYEVAASGATDQHVTTAGGVKLYVLPGAGGYNLKAFGAVGDGVIDDSDAVEKFFLALENVPGEFYEIPRAGRIDACDVAYLVTRNITTPTNMQRRTIHWDGRIFGNVANAPVITITDALFVNFFGIQIENTSTTAGARALKVQRSYIINLYGGLLISSGDYSYEYQGNALNHYGVAFRGGKEAPVYCYANTDPDQVANLFMGGAIEGILPDGVTYSKYGIVFDASGSYNYGKQTLVGVYFEAATINDVRIKKFGHSIELDRCHHSCNETKSLVYMENTGPSAAFDIKVRDPFVRLNVAAITVDLLEQQNATTMNGARYSGAKYQDTIGGGAFYEARKAVGAINERSADFTVGVLDAKFETGTGWTSSGGTAPTFNNVSIDTYGKGKTTTKAGGGYIYQTLKVKPNTLYRVNVTALCAADPAAEAAINFFDTGLSVNLTNGFGINSTNATVATPLEYYWQNGANTSVNILLRNIGGAGSVSFGGELTLTDMQSAAAY